MHIKRNYNLIINKEKNKPDGKLRFRIKWNNNKTIVDFNIGYRVESAKWSRLTMILYHVSNTKTETINFERCRPYKDFGKGFYLTELE